MPGERIKKIYEHLGMSQRAFAVSIGMGPTSLARVVTGQTGVSRLLANSIELMHGYSSDWIMKPPQLDDNDLIPKSPWSNLNPRIQAILVSFNQFSIAGAVAFLEKGLTTHIDDILNSRIRQFEQSVHFSFEEYGRRMQQHIVLKSELLEAISKIRYRMTIAPYKYVLYRVFASFSEENAESNVEKIDAEILVDVRSKQKIIDSASQIVFRTQKIAKLWSIEEMKS